MYFVLLQRGRSQTVTVSDDDSVISTSASVNGTQTGMYVATLWAHSYQFWLEK